MLLFSPLYENNSRRCPSRILITGCVLCLNRSLSETSQAPVWIHRVRYGLLAYIRKHLQCMFPNFGIRPVTLIHFQQFTLVAGFSIPVQPKCCLARRKGVTRCHVKLCLTGILQRHGERPRKEQKDAAHRAGDRTHAAHDVGLPDDTRTNVDEANVWICCGKPPESKRGHADCLPGAVLEAVVLLEQEIFVKDLAFPPCPKDGNNSGQFLTSRSLIQFRRRLATNRIRA